MFCFLDTMLDRQERGCPLPNGGLVWEGSWVPLPRNFVFIFEFKNGEIWSFSVLLFTVLWKQGSLGQFLQSEGLWKQVWGPGKLWLLCNSNTGELVVYLTIAVVHTLYMFGFRIFWVAYIVGLSVHWMYCLLQFSNKVSRNCATIPMPVAFCTFCSFSNDTLHQLFRLCSP